MFLCQQVPWIPKELYITGYNWVTNLTGFITIWIVRHTLQFFPNLPHMNHRISIDLANIPPTHSPEKCVIKSHTMGCPQPILGILGSSKSIGRVPGAVVGRPLWASSSSADWWLPGIGDPNIAIFGDLNGIEMDFTKKNMMLYENLLEIWWDFTISNWLCPKMIPKMMLPDLFWKENLQEKPDMGGKTCCRCSRKSL